MTADGLAFKLIESFLVAIALVLLLPISILWIECMAALFPPRQGLQSLPCPQGFAGGSSSDSRAQAQGNACGGGNSPDRVQVNVLIPAHNEALILKATLEQLLPELEHQDRLLVIADNCDDETATVARAVGVEVIERREPEKRGKGYALDYGLKFIAEQAQAPSVVLLIDADSIVHPGTVDRLARMASATARPVQATYLLHSSDRPEPKEAISAFAFLVKNLVRPRGLDRLGLPCLLTGTGMAFPWSAIEAVSWASGNIVEDMQLGLDLAIAGYAPLLCLEAKVTGLLPRQQHAAKSQRTRWEHGHLKTLLTQVPRLIKASLSQKHFALFALGLDLLIPPLSLLVILWLTTITVALLTGLLGGVWLPAILSAVAGTLLLLSIFSAWAKFFSHGLPLSTILGIPMYLLWKIPLYLAFLFRPQIKWVRTERDVVKD